MTMSLDVRGYTESFGYSDYSSLDKTDSDQVNAWLESEHPRRGDVQVVLTSPQQTRSVLLPFRRRDFINTEGYSDWPFMSVHHWGEAPQGQWTLAVHFNSSEGFVEVSGVSIELFGTMETPEAVRDIPTHCHSECRRGCSGEGQENCDACQRLRIAATLECVSVCPLGTAASDGYCLESSSSSAPDNSTNAYDNITPTRELPTTEGAQNNASTGATLVAALSGGLVAAVLLVILAILLCILAYVSLRKTPIKYKVFGKGSTSNHHDNIDNPSLSTSSINIMDTAGTVQYTDNDCDTNSNSSWTNLV